jgi:outer membrane receptor protein involved in Fe transport
MIANAGLRLDLWYSGVDYYPDLYTPFGEPDSLGRFTRPTAFRESPPCTRLQPRLGVSFPITATTVFHLNYGSFMQRPPFQYIVSQRLGHRLNDPVILGNPTLEPETTSSYDVGVVQGLGNGFTLDVSGYYKDVNNLIQQANFIDDRAGIRSAPTSTSTTLTSAASGWRSRGGRARSPARSTTSTATRRGRARTPRPPRPSSAGIRLGVVTTDLTNVPTRDIVLDFDRQHNAILSAAY